jgi:WD40 repeat protein
MTTHSADNTTLVCTVDRLEASFNLTAAATPCLWSLSLYLWLWDRATGAKWKLRQGEHKKVRWISISSDSRRFLVTGPEGCVLYVWDVASRKQLCRIPVPTGSPNRGVLSADGRSVACGIWRRHLFLWRLSN